jgi:hypothetical protein
MSSGCVSGASGESASRRERTGALPGALRGRPAQRGSALLGAMLFAVAMLGLITVTTMMSSVEVRESRNSVDDVRVRFLAESGIEMGVGRLSAAATLSAHDPLGGIEGLFAAGPVQTSSVGDPVMNGAAQVGSYSLTMTLVDRTATSVSVRLDATGYVPTAPQTLGPNERVRAWHAASVTVRYSLAVSDVFDYAYFINNWGWFYGNTILCYGNARSNGQFDVAGYKPTVTGQPLYDLVTWDGANATLSGYRDDNGDGLEDGNDGGIFSGWDIVSAQNVQGNGGKASNQHDFEDQIPMPNLSDLAGYKIRAKAAGSTLSVGGTVVSDAVYGDDAGEKQNLYLVGTAADPIVLNGPIVVEGDVIISGYVTGQGAIYSGGNIYCPNSVKYLDPPATPRPADNTQASTETWLADNWKKDFLGLFAKENVVVGDHTNSTWRSYVSGWMSSKLNSSKEDAGADGIPNTKAGKDGISGTADDDLLESDGVFTTDYYTQADADYGLIPAGKSVGDVIPGTGEDIDGDGVYDGTTTLADIDFSTPLAPAFWGGNMPVAGIEKYKDIASLYANELDAVFYTNHTFAYVVFGSDAARINGSIVSRNESIVYGTPSISINYDCRILGGNSGMAGELLPQELEAPEILRWSTLVSDPNRYAVAP